MTRGPGEQKRLCRKRWPQISPSSTGHLERREAAALYINVNICEWLTVTTCGHLLGRVPERGLLEEKWGEAGATHWDFSKKQTPTHLEGHHCAQKTDPIAEVRCPGVQTCVHSKFFCGFQGDLGHSSKEAAELISASDPWNYHCSLLFPS